MDPLERFFGPAGDLAQHHPRYEPRPGQLAMARAVGRVLAEGGRLMVEAGTGTGKTLAYLVPALRADRRVVISTGTRNLQDQIWQQDLPFLRDRAGLRVAACVMKGRDNYLCRYRLAEFEREPLLEDLGEAPWLPRIAAWSRETASGDRAEIADLPDRLRFWRDLNARADTCTGSRCPEFEACWLTRLKRKAQEARILVVNHHLFFADLAVRTAFGAVIPDYDTVIFDEAHLLEEIATLYFGTQVSAAQVEEPARELERLAKRSGEPPPARASAELRAAAATFFAPLRDRLGGEQGRVVFEPVDRGGPDLEAEWRRLDAALDEIARLAAECESSTGAAESLPRRTTELRERLQFILRRDDPAFVHGMESRGRGNVILSASPVDVSELLQQSLFEQLHACVLTSATLTVESSFDFFASRLGLALSKQLIVDSSMDHEKQALLYLPRAMPEPSRREFVPRMVEVVQKLLELSGGRAFLLFTSYANLYRVQDALNRSQRWPLFVQGQGSKVAMVEEFKRTERAVLLGTSSFWQGVDVPGRALSLVVVDRLPFDVPTDALIAARIERIRQRSGNPFVEYQLPLAVLQLKQGLGRLLRSSRDRGVLAVMDPRLVRRRYGRSFLRSLPPYRVVRELDECRSFFEESTKSRTETRCR